MIRKEIIVEKTTKILKLLQDYGFSFYDVSKMLRQKDVKINGKVVKSGNDNANEGDVVVFFFNDEVLKKKYDVVFEDDDVAVVYKHQGIETAGEKGLEKMLNLIAVHRLDRNTEGIVVFAKNEETEKKLISAFKNDKIHKHYCAEVSGKFLTDKKEFSAYLVKDSENSFVKIYKNKVPNSVLIKTIFQTVKVGQQTSLIDVELLTGKTHQIRAHLAFLGYPIIGDGKYGREDVNKKFNQSKQKLCCYSLKFDYVGIRSLDFMEFTSKPDWFFVN